MTEMTHAEAQALIDLNHRLPGIVLRPVVALARILVDQIGRVA